MKTLFVRNLPYSTTEGDLRKAFEVYGRVLRSSIAKNRETGESRGFGFVDMEDDAAGKAIAEMNGRSMGNRQIIVQESDSRGRTGSAASGPRPAGTGGAATAGGAPAGARPSGPSTGPRPAGASRPTSAGSTGPRNFGAPAAPAAERARVYHERKDRLKPYKRDHFDFRGALEDEEEAKGKPPSDGDSAPDAPK